MYVIVSFSIISSSPLWWVHFLGLTWIWARPFLLNLVFWLTLRHRFTWCKNMRIMSMLIALYLLCSNGMDVVYVYLVIKRGMAILDISMKCEWYIKFPRYSISVLTVFEWWPITLELIWNLIKYSLCGQQLLLLLISSLHFWTRQDILCWVPLIQNVLCLFTDQI